MARSPLLARYSKAMDGLERTLGALAGLGLAGFVVIILIDVIFREILLKPLFAPSELSVCLFIWSTMLAAAVAARRNSHFVIDFLPQTLPRPVESTLAILAGTAAVVFAAVLLIYGAEMAERGIGRRSPMSGFSMALFFSAFPVAGFAFLLFTAENLAKVILGRKEVLDG